MKSNQLEKFDNNNENDDKNKDFKIAFNPRIFDDYQHSTSNEENKDIKDTIENKENKINLYDGDRNKERYMESFYDNTSNVENYYDNYEETNFYHQNINENENFTDLNINSLYFNEDTDNNINFIGNTTIIHKNNNDYKDNNDLTEFNNRGTNEILKIKINNNNIAHHLTSTDALQRINKSKPPIFEVNKGNKIIGNKKTNNNCASSSHILQKKRFIVIKKGIGKPGINQNRIRSYKVRVINYKDKNKNESNRGSYNQNTMKKKLFYSFKPLKNTNILKSMNNTNISGAYQEKDKDKKQLFTSFKLPKNTLIQEHSKEKLMFRSFKKETIDTINLLSNDDDKYESDRKNNKYQSFFEYCQFNNQSQSKQKADSNSITGNIDNKYINKNIYDYFQRSGFKSQSKNKIQFCSKKIVKPELKENKNREVSISMSSIINQNYIKPKFVTLKKTMNRKNCIDNNKDNLNINLNDDNLTDSQNKASVNKIKKKSNNNNNKNKRYKEDENEYIAENNSNDDEDMTIKDNQTYDKHSLQYKSSKKQNKLKKGKQGKQYKQDENDDVELIDLELLNDMPKITFTDLILALLEVTINFSSYNFGIKFINPMYRTFWESLNSFPLFDRILHEYNHTILRKCWKMLKQVKIRKLVSNIRENSEVLDSWEYDFKSLVECLIDAIMKKKSVEENMKIYIKKIMNEATRDINLEKENNESNAIKENTGFSLNNDINYDNEIDELFNDNDCLMDTEMNNNNEEDKEKRYLNTLTNKKNKIILDDEEEDNYYYYRSNNKDELTINLEYAFKPNKSNKNNNNLNSITYKENKQMLTDNSMLSSNPNNKNLSIEEYLSAELNEYHDSFQALSINNHLDDVIKENKEKIALEETEELNNENNDKDKNNPQIYTIYNSMVDNELDQLFSGNLDEEIINNGQTGIDDVKSDNNYNNNNKNNTYNSNECNVSQRILVNNDLDIKASNIDNYIKDNSKNKLHTCIHLLSKKEIKEIKNIRDISYLKINDNQYNKSICAFDKSVTRLSELRESIRRKEESKYTIDKDYKKLLKSNDKANLINARNIALNYVKRQENIEDKILNKRIINNNNNDDNIHCNIHSNSNSKDYIYKEIKGFLVFVRKSFILENQYSNNSKNSEYRFLIKSFSDSDLLNLLLKLDFNIKSTITSISGLFDFFNTVINSLWQKRLKQIITKFYAIAIKKIKCIMKTCLKNDKSNKTLHNMIYHNNKSLVKSVFSDISVYQRSLSKFLYKIKSIEFFSYQSYSIFSNYNDKCNFNRNRNSVGMVNKINQLSYIDNIIHLNNCKLNKETKYNSIVNRKKSKNIKDKGNDNCKDNGKNNKDRNVRMSKKKNKISDNNNDNDNKYFRKHREDYSIFKQLSTSNIDVYNAISFNYLNKQNKMD